MKRFYHPDTLEINQNIYLDDLAAHHALQVMRVEVKDRFIVFNGDGYNYKVEVISVEKKKLKINIISKDENHSESKMKIILIQSLSTNEKMDWIIQKATELGVNQILPIYSTRSIIKLDSTRADKKLMHWQQVLISACEQSGRSIIPQIYKPTSFIQALEKPEFNEKTLKLILTPNGQVSLDNLGPLNNKEIILLIGPEGGFSEEELKLANDYKFTSLKLGPRILRTETAPLSILSIIQFKYGDLS